MTRSGNTAGGAAGSGNGETWGGTAGEVATPVCGAPGATAGIGDSTAKADMGGNTGDVYT